METPSARSSNLRGSIHTVGIIGAGLMGRGIAAACFMHSVSTVLVDLSERILNDARDEIQKALRLQQLFPSTSSPPGHHPETRIHYNTNYAALSDCDYLIENVTEDRVVKKDTHDRLQGVCPPDVVIAVNTSTIPITEISSWHDHVDRIIGVHFMNPVPLKNVVELVKGFHTSADCLAVTQAFLHRIGKSAIVVNDGPGFVSNRVLMLAVNEAIFLVQEGVATPQDADRVFVDCLGHPMGPLELADLIGLDTVFLSLVSLHETFREAKYRPCPRLKMMVDAGLLGRKSGRGFYEYS